MVSTTTCNTKGGEEKKREAWGKLWSDWSQALWNRWDSCHYCVILALQVPSDPHCHHVCSKLWWSIPGPEKSVQLCSHVRFQSCVMLENVNRIQLQEVDLITGDLFGYIACLVITQKTGCNWSFISCLFWLKWGNWQLAHPKIDATATGSPVPSSWVVLGCRSFWGP